MSTILLLLPLKLLLLIPIRIKGIVILLTLIIE